MATKTCILAKLLAGLSLCLGMAEGLLAQPVLTVTINGTLGGWISGTGEITNPGRYVSGLTATGTSSTQYCVITYVGGTTSASAKVYLGTGFGTNQPVPAQTISSNTLKTPSAGYNGASPPTTATVTNGPGTTCTGTAVVSGVKVDDSVGLSGSSFTGITTVDPTTVTYTSSTSSMYSADLSLSDPAYPVTFECSAANTTPNPATVNVVAPVSGNDTIQTNCTFNAAGGVTFASTIALLGGTLPTAVPLAFPMTNVISAASSSTYIPLNSEGTFVNDVTTLGVSGTITAVCSGCPTENLTPAGPLALTSVRGGPAPSPTSVTVGSSPTENEAYAVTTSASWLTVNGGSTTGGQIGGSFNVGVNPSAPGVVVGLNTGTVTVYTAASNSPQTETVNFTLTLPNLVPSAASYTFNSVNSAVPASQNLTVTTSVNSNVAFTATPSSTGNWLSVSTTTGTTGVTTISVSADPTKTSVGVNSGFITLTSAGAANSGLQVPVTFNVTSVPAPASLTFTATAGGANPANQPLSVTSTGPAVSYTAAVTSGSSWLSVAPGSGTTNGAAQTVSVNIGSLNASGSPYGGTITVTPNGAASIPVTVTLTLTSLPSMVPPASSPAFISNAGSQPNSQTLTVTSSTSTVVNYTATASTSTGGNWLQVAPSSASTSGSETVSINPGVLSGLATGTYNGAVLFTCSPTTSCANTNGQLSVPVTLTVTAALSSVPTSLTFNYTIGGSTPASQPITVTSNGGAITYTAVAATTTGGNWLAVSPGSATTSASPGLTGSVNASALSGLTPNSYHGTITLTSSGATNSPFTIPATLVVAAEPTLQVTSNSLTFNMVGTGTLPLAQSLTVSASNGSSIPFTIAVATTSGGSWLSAPSSGNTSSGNISVSILANSLTPATYNGTLTITSPQASGSAVVNVQLNVNSISLSPSPLTLNYQLGSSHSTVTQNLSVSSILPTPLNLNFTAAASVSTPSGGTWLSVGPTGGTTPLTLTVTATPGSLSAGSYSGTITVSSGGATFTVPVTLAIAALPSLTTAPNVLPFNFTIGGSLPSNQSVTVGSNGAALSGVSASTSTPWLTIVSQSGTSTPFNLVVGLNAAGLASLTPGPYSGTITITAQPGTTSNSPLSYPVTLTVSASPALSVTPSRLTFNGTVGAANPGSQTLTVNGANGTIAFTAAPSPSGAWLSVTPTSGTTNTTLQVSVNTMGLAANTYNGSITVTSTTAGVLNNPTVIPVTLTLAANSLTAAPSPIAFTYELGGAAPQPQTLNVGSTIAGLSVSAVPDASWLKVTPASGATPLALSVSILTTGLTAGPYQANITLTAAGASNSPLTVPVNLTVASATAQPAVAGVFNSASYAFPPLQNSSIAQGSFFTIFGTGNAGQEIGPATPAIWSPWPLPTTLPKPGGTSVSVTIGNNAAVAAYIYYTSATQVNAVLPSTTPIGTGTLTVTYNGQTSPTFPITVVASSFGTFAWNEAGTGPGVMTNAITGVNITPFHTVKPGDYVTLWGTGLGAAADPSTEATAPPTQTNLCATAANCPVTVWVAGLPASVTYAGRSSFVAEDQIDFIVPPGAQGCYVQVAVQIGQVVGNFNSLSVDRNGNTCSDKDGVDYSEIASVIGSTGQANIGSIIMLSNYLNLSDVPLVGKVQWDNDEVAATVGTFTSGDWSGAPSFCQQFGCMETIEKFQGFALAPSVGNCTVTPFEAVPLPPPGDPGLAISFLDAGANLSVTGPDGTQSVPTNKGFDLVGGYSLCQLVTSLGLTIPDCPASTTNGAPLFLTKPPAYALDAFPITVTGTGGAAVGPLSAPITVSQAAASFTWTNRNVVTAAPIARDTPLTITWTGGDPNGFVNITAVSSTLQSGIPTSNPPSPPGVLAECVAAASDGKFSIPAYVLQSLPSTVGSTATVPPGELLVGPASSVCSSISGGPASTCPAMTTPTGLDALYIVYHFLQGQNVDWK